MDQGLKRILIQMVDFDQTSKNKYQNLKNYKLLMQKKNLQSKIERKNQKKTKNKRLLTSSVVIKIHKYFSLFTTIYIAIIISDLLNSLHQ